MLGPYAWVPPNYWSDPVAKEMYGGPNGFATEISPGAAPMTSESWAKTTSGSGQEWCPSHGGAFSDVWNYHCGNEHGIFKDLSYFTPSLDLRYGGNFSNGIKNEGERCEVSSSVEAVPGEDLDVFLAKSQLASYESHRAMFEAYSGSKYNSTGVIQWMLNNGHPQHIWHLFDWFLDGGGSYL